MNRVYLDTNVVIAIVEDGPPGTGHVRAWLEQRVTPPNSLVVSDLVRMECRVKPLRIDDPMLLADYDAYFASGQIEVVGLSPVVCDLAAAIRARTRTSLADALHLAAAIEGGCDLFVTADQRLGSFTDITVAVLSA